MSSTRRFDRRTLIRWAGAAFAGAATAAVGAHPTPAQPPAPATLTTGGSTSVRPEQWVPLDDTGLMVIVNGGTKPVTVTWKLTTVKPGVRAFEISDGAHTVHGFDTGQPPGAMLGGAYSHDATGTFGSLGVYKVAV